MLKALRIGGVTTGDKLNDSVTALEAYKALNKRERPSSFSVTIDNSSDADYLFSLNITSAVKDSERDSFPTGIDISSSVEGGIDSLGLLLSLQKPLITKTVFQVDTDEEVVQFGQAVNFVKSDFDGETSKSLKNQIAMAKASSKDEERSRTIDAIYVLDESTNLFISVKKDCKLTVTFKIAEFLNRSW